jgi:hypothetical protein
MADAAEATAAPVVPPSGDIANSVAFLTLSELAGDGTVTSAKYVHCIVFCIEKM